MGTHEEEKNLGNHQQELKKIVKTPIAWLPLLVVSLAGGLVLGWWEYHYHPKNRQLWMVPVGLILLVTPMVIWFAVVVSETCSPKDENISRTSRAAVQVRDSVNGVEKCIRVITV